MVGNVGLWSERIYLAGGLAPRYIVGQLPEDASAHVGTTDVDLVIGLAIDSDPPDTYYTLATNLERAGFHQEADPSFRWTREVDGVRVIVELLGEVDDEQPGHSFQPKGQRTGSGLALLNVPGASLVAKDYFEVEVEAERLDGGGTSKVTVRVAGVLPYTVLKIQAFQRRHENKDAYDLVFTLVNYGGGAEEAGVVAAASAIAGHPQVEAALQLLEERFADTGQDAPIAYAGFLADPEDPDADARLRQEAVAAARAFVRSYRRAREGAARRTDSIS